MTAAKGRRGFFARLLGLVSIPVAAKVTAALPVHGWPARGASDTSTIDLAEATVLARTWTKGLFRMEPYVPTCSVYAHHPPSDYFFCWVDRGELYVGGAETIAVRKSEGRVTHCGMVGE